VIRQLGPASGGVVNGGISKSLMVIVFLAVFLLWCVLVLVGVRLRAAWRATAPVVAEEPEALAPEMPLHGSGDGEGHGLAAAQRGFASARPHGAEEQEEDRVGAFPAQSIR
jgi:hypothetical protein